MSRAFTPGTSQRFADHRGTAHRSPALEDDPVRVRGTDNPGEGVGPYGEEVGDRTLVRPCDGQPEDRAGAGGHRVDGLSQRQVTCYDEESSGLQGIGPAHRVEGVADVVAAPGQGHARVQEGAYGGQATWGAGRGVAALEVEVGERQCDDPDPGCRRLLGDPGGLGRVQASQSHAVAGGRTVGEAPLPYRLGEQQQILRIRTEMLVRMQIDADAVPLGDGQDTDDGGLRVVGEVRAATEQVGPQLQCLVEDFIGRLDVQHGDLQCDPLAQLLAQPQQRPKPRSGSGPGRTSAWVRTAVVPLATSSSRARRALTSTSSSVTCSA